MDYSEVWLAGKGPSLDKFKWLPERTPRYAVNEVGLVIPDCAGIFALDYRVFDKLLETDIPIYKKHNHRRYKFQNEVLWTTEEVPNVYATAVVAIQILCNQGARIIHCVGFDSIDGCGGYAETIKSLEAEGTNTDNYRKINDNLLATIEKLGVECVWEHRYV